MSTAVALLLVLIVWNATASRRVWAPGEVPVAFWSWRVETPSETDVNEAVRQTGAKTLFLRAGQIDIENGKLCRIHPVSGSIPTNIAVHLVYNATRSFLKDFEQIGVDDAGRTILAAFEDDLDRAHADRAQVAGLQLDFDVPTRLLPNYAALLRNLRAQLSKELQVSITGLPTWLDSPALVELSVCDFWVPQCYGAQIPEWLDQRIPITSPEHLARSIARTRDLGLPFYAGLAAYGYAIHYSRAGSLIGLRGDLDPLLVVANADFELSDQKPFLLNANQAGEKEAGEWRCTYRARRDVMVDGTAIRAGESLLLERPTAEGLRACARSVREQAGTRLLGICIFRMPTKGDSTTLTLQEIASALGDITPHFSLDARVNHLLVDNREKRNVATVLELENNGAASSKTGKGALTVLVRVPGGCLESVLVDQFSSAQTMFESGDSAVRCDVKRANAVRLSVASWPPGAKLTARFEIRGRALGEVSLRYEATLDDNSVTEGSITLTMDGAR